MNKKKWVIPLSIVLCLAVILGIVIYFAPYTPRTRQEGEQAMEKATAYGLSTTLSGTDCYLDQLATLKEDGMTRVELCLREDYEEEAPLLAPAMEKIKAQGMEVWSIHIPFGNSVDPSEQDETKRLQNLENIERFVSLTADCGAQVYVIHGSFEPVTGEARAEKIAACVRSMAELTGFVREKAGAQLALENLPRTCIGNTIEEIALITDQVPDLQICFDTNHFTLPRPDYMLRPLQRLVPSLREKKNPVQDTPEAFAARFAGRIATLHISDYDGIDECHWLPGQGIVDFHSIWKTLTDAGFRSPAVFEPNEKGKGVRTTGKRLIEGFEQSAGISV